MPRGPILKILPLLAEGELFREWKEEAEDQTPEAAEKEDSV